MSNDRVIYFFGYVSDGGTGGFVWNEDKQHVQDERARLLDGKHDVSSVLSVAVDSLLGSDETTDWLDNQPELWEPTPGQGR